MVILAIVNFEYANLSSRSGSDNINIYSVAIAASLFWCLWLFDVGVMDESVSF